MNFSLMEHISVPHFLSDQLTNAHLESGRIGKKFNQPLGICVAKMIRIRVVFFYQSFSSCRLGDHLRCIQASALGSMGKR